MTNKQRSILVDLNTKPHPISAAAKQLKERMEVIVQEIIAASETTMIAYGLDAYGNKYRVGTFIWARLFTSLPQILAEDKNWSFSTKSNVLILSTNIDGLIFNFHIPKVDSDSRVPTGAKSVKEAVKYGEWLFLDESLRELKSSSEPILLTYDITPQEGLGKITVNELTYMGGKDFLSVTMAELYDSATAENMHVVPQEKILPAKITMGTVTVQKSNEEIHPSKAIK